MLEILFKKKGLIIFGMILFMFFQLAIKVVIQLNYVTMTMSISYPGVENGVNPDGTRFNIFEMTSDKVLERTLAKLNLPNITVDDLRSRINIYPIIQTGVNEKIKSASATGKDYAYFPNEYLIIYSQKDKFASNHTTELLETLSASFQEIFKEKYTDKNTVLTNIKFNTQDYEYIELSDVYNNKINSIIDYLTTKKYENGSFRSTTTNQTFENLINEYQKLMDIDVANFHAFVSTSRVARNNQELLSKMHYDVDNLKLDYAKLVKETELSKVAMKTYDSTIVDSAFIPSVDKNNDFYMNKTKTGLDYLTKRALEVGVTAENTNKEIDNTNKLIKDYSSAKVLPTEQQRLIGVSDNMIKNIESKVIDLAKISAETVSEYSAYKTKDYIKYKIPVIGVKNFISVDYIKSALFNALIGLVLMVLFVITINIKKLFEKKKVEPQLKKKKVGAH